MKKLSEKCKLMSPSCATLKQYSKTRDASLFEPKNKTFLWFDIISIIFLIKFHH